MLVAYVKTCMDVQLMLGMGACVSDCHAVFLLCGNRIPGEQKNVQALRRQCQHGNFDAIEEESNPHTVCAEYSVAFARLLLPCHSPHASLFHSQLASVFKLWLRELAEPVIPISM